MTRRGIHNGDDTVSKATQKAIDDREKAKAKDAAKAEKKKTSEE